MLRAVTRAVIAIVSFVLLGATARARADGPYEGDWRAGPMRIEVAVESWGGDCGPRPQSTTVPGGSAIRVTQSGDDLTFAGRPQRTTRGCWSENASVRRVSSRYQSGTWSIMCRTPQEDPRAEVGTYTLRAVGTDQIEFRDQSRYDWALNESRCIASITSTQTFQRVSGPVATQPTPEPTATPTAEPACTPGAPARVTLRPATVDVEPGGRACFTARVVDANGCTVRGRSARLELRSPPGATARLQGSCFEAAGSAAEAEGAFTIIARDGAMEAQARVRVRTPDLSDLIARRAEGGGAVSLEGEETTSEEAARVAARGESGGRPSLIWVLLGAAIGLLLVGGATFGLLARGRRRKKADEAFTSPRETVGEAPPPAPVVIAAPAPAQPISTEPKICPTCRRGYPPDATRCESDDTELVKYADFVAKSATPSSAATKVCPVCGDRFPATTRFCGKDGATLVER